MINKNDQSVYGHCWESFASFVSVNWAKYKENEGFNSLEGWTGEKLSLEPKSAYLMFGEGPVAWPKNGYVTAQGTAAGEDFYGATSFIDNGNMYIFSPYFRCLRIIKTDITNGLDYYDWKFLKNGTFSENSLPNGYTRENYMNFLSAKVNYDCINLENKFSVADLGINYPSYYYNIVDFNTQYFQVARLKKNGIPTYYIATAETQFQICFTLSDPKCTNRELAIYKSAYGIRISPDLINWSPAVYFTDTEKEWGLGNGKYSYPTLLNKEGTSNSEVDIENFYIVGKNADNGADPINGYQTNIINLSLECIKPEKIKILYLGNKTLNLNTTTLVPYSIKKIFSWGQWAKFYATRVDKINSGTGHCKDKEDYCTDRQKEAYFEYTPEPDTEYAVWIHPIGYCTHWTDWGEADIYKIKVAKKGDFKLDTVVNQLDIKLFAEKYFKVDPDYENISNLDINADRNLDIKDLVLSMQ